MMASTTVRKSFLKYRRASDDPDGSLLPETQQHNINLRDIICAVTSHSNDDITLDFITEYDNQEQSEDILEPFPLPMLAFTLANKTPAVHHCLARVARTLFCHTHKRNHSTVQCRGVGIFGALGLGDQMEDALEFQAIPSTAFNQRLQTSSNTSPKQGRKRKAPTTKDRHINKNRDTDSDTDVVVPYPVAAEAGFGHSVVLTNDGKLYLFGRAFDINSVVRIYGVYKYSSYFARLATKLTIEADRDHKIEVLTSPFFIPGMDRYTFTKVACSGGLTAALTSTGQIFCFGVNKFGQCGTGEMNERYWFPSVNVGVPKVRDVDVGLQHAICLCIGGDVYTWGKGKNGQMGNGEELEVNAHSIKVALPVRAKAVAAGLNHCAAVGEDGQVYVWGRRMAPDLVEGSKATYQDQTFPRAVALPHALRAQEVFCSSFSTVIRANDDSLWVIGVDEINQEVSLEFQPVFEALLFEEESYTEAALDTLPKVAFSATNCVLKKGYHAVSVISACRQKVYDVTLQRGTARLFEVILDPRADVHPEEEAGPAGRDIVDYSAGFRHCLMLTTSSSSTSTTTTTTT